MDSQQVKRELLLSQVLVKVKKLLIDSSTCNQQPPSPRHMHPTGSVVFMAEKTSGCFVCLLAYLWFQLMDVVVFQVCAGILWGCQEDRYRMRTFLLLVSGLNPQLQDTAGRYLSTNSYIRVSWHVYPDNEWVCVYMCGWFILQGACACLFAVNHRLGYQF